MDFKRDLKIFYRRFKFTRDDDTFCTFTLDGV